MEGSRHPAKAHSGAVGEWVNTPRCQAAGAPLTLPLCVLEAPSGPVPILPAAPRAGSFPHPHPVQRGWFQAQGSLGYKKLTQLTA